MTQFTNLLIESLHFAGDFAELLGVGVALLVLALFRCCSLKKGRVSSLWWCILCGCLGWRWLFCILRGQAVSSRYLYGGLVLLLVFAAFGWPVLAQWLKLLLPAGQIRRRLTLLAYLGLTGAIIGVGIGKSVRFNTRERHLQQVEEFFAPLNTDEYVVWDQTRDIGRLRYKLPAMRFEEIAKYSEPLFWTDLQNLMLKYQFSSETCYLLLQQSADRPERFENDFRRARGYFPFIPERSWTFRSTLISLYRFEPAQDGVRRPGTASPVLVRSIGNSGKMVLRYAALFQDGVVPEGIFIRPLDGNGRSYDDGRIIAPGGLSEDGSVRSTIELQNIMGISLGTWELLLTAVPDKDAGMITLPEYADPEAFQPGVYGLPRQIMVGDAGWRLNFSEMITRSDIGDWHFEIFTPLAQFAVPGTALAQWTVTRSEIPPVGLPVRIRCKWKNRYQVELNTTLMGGSTALPEEATVLVLAGRVLQKPGWIDEFRKYVPSGWNFIRNRRVPPVFDFEGGAFVSYPGLWRGKVFYDTAEPNRFLDWKDEFNVAHFSRGAGIEKLDRVVLLLGGEEIIRIGEEGRYESEISMAVRGVIRSFLDAYPDCRIVVAGIPAPPPSQIEWGGQTERENSTAFWWLRRRLHWRFITLLLENIPDDPRVTLLPLYAEWAPQWYRIKNDKESGSRGAEWSLTPDGYDYLYKRIIDNL